MTNIDLENLKTTLKNQFKYRFPDDFKVEIDFLEHTNELNVCLFWNQKNELVWDGTKTFRFKVDEYSKVLENEIKPFVLSEKH